MVVVKSIYDMKNDLKIIDFGGASGNFSSINAYTLGRIDCSKFCRQQLTGDLTFQTRLDRIRAELYCVAVLVSYCSQEAPMPQLFRGKIQTDEFN